MVQVDFIEIAGYCLLFCLVFGMSATVDIGCMQAQLKNRKAILTGVFLQFVVLPFLGFAVVKALNMNHATGITLLVVTSSPGGSYSNWWCSMFNADLALSVCMTCVSTFLSILMLPINLLIYAQLAYDDDIIGSLDWKSLFISLAVVIGAIGLGLIASEKFNSHNFNVHANRLGNFAGISLVVFSAVVGSGGGNSDEESSSRPWEFYVGVALPCILGLLVANIVTSFLSLAKPERVTTSIECCYQNVGIATSVALTMFQGDELSEAMGVPLYYGLVEAVVLGIYCIIAWKGGWTKSPPDTPFFTMISTSYEVIYAETAEKEQLKSLKAGEVPFTESDLGAKPEDEVTTDYVQHEEGAPPTPPRPSIRTSARDSIVIGGTPQRRNPRRRAPKEPSFLATSLPPKYFDSLRGSFNLSAVNETDEKDTSQNGAMA